MYKMSVKDKKQFSLSCFCQTIWR